MDVSPEAIGFLRRAQVQPPAAVARAGAPARALRELEQAHHCLIACHLEKEIRSARVLKELRPEL